MAHGDPLSGVLLDEVALNVEELARACEVEPAWVLRHVEAGVLGEHVWVGAVLRSSCRFRSDDRVRAACSAWSAHSTPMKTLPHWCSIWATKSTACAPACGCWAGSSGRCGEALE